jgi:putative transposon-encoded protein
MIKITLERGKLQLSDEIVGFIRKKVVPQGNGAHVICPKEYIGRTVYLIVCKD